MPKTKKPTTQTIILADSALSEAREKLLTHFQSNLSKEEYEWLSLALLAARENAIFASEINLQNILAKLKEKLMRNAEGRALMFPLVILALALTIVITLNVTIDSLLVYQIPMILGGAVGGGLLIGFIAYLLIKPYFLEKANQLWNARPLVFSNQIRVISSSDLRLAEKISLKEEYLLTADVREGVFSNVLSSSQPKDLQKIETLSALSLYFQKEIGALKKDLTEQDLVHLRGTFLTHAKAVFQALPEKLWEIINDRLSNNETLSNIVVDILHTQHPNSRNKNRSVSGMLVRDIKKKEEKNEMTRKIELLLADYLALGHELHEKQHAVPLRESHSSGKSDQNSDQKDSPPPQRGNGRAPVLARPDISTTDDPSFSDPSFSDPSSEKEPKPKNGTRPAQHSERGPSLGKSSHQLHSRKPHRHGKGPANEKKPDSVSSVNKQ